MNKKFICLFGVFLVAVLAMGCVSAANLVDHDFDGYFSMKVPKGVNFQKELNSTNESEFKMDSATYISDNLVIFYMDTPLFSENSSYAFYQLMFESVNPDLTKCYESQEDNLRILEPITKDTTHFPIVGTNSGNKTIVLAGDNVQLLKEMGHTIKFK